MPGSMTFEADRGEKRDGEIGSGFSSLAPGEWTGTVAPPAGKTRTNRGQRPWRDAAFFAASSRDRGLRDEKVHGTGRPRLMGR